VRPTLACSDLESAPKPTSGGGSSGCENEDANGPVEDEPLYLRIVRVLDGRLHLRNEAEPGPTVDRVRVQRRVDVQDERERQRVQERVLVFCRLQDIRSAKHEDANGECHLVDQEEKEKVKLKTKT